MILTNPQFDPQEFADWLRTLPKDEPAGIPDSHCECPLANWLKTKYGAVGVGSTINIYSIHAEFPTADWMNEFINEFDLLRDDPQAIAPQNCLKILSEIVGQEVIAA